MYIGLALLNKPAQSEYQNITTQQSDASKIEFVNGPEGAGLPVIDISSHRVIHHESVTGHSLSDITDPQYTFRRYRTRNTQCKTPDPIFLSRNLSFEGFSRPPPVTA